MTELSNLWDSNGKPVKPFWPYLIGLFYLAVLLFLFLGEMWTRPIWLDEELTIFQIKDKSFSELISSFSLGVNAIPYLYFVLLWEMDQVMTLDLFSIRILSFLFGLSSILSLHFFLRRFFEEAVTFVSICTGLLLLPKFVLYSAEARPYSALLLLVVLNLITTRSLSRGSVGAYLSNLFVCFLVPSIHYVGLFYSGVLFITFLLLEGKQAIKLSSSFLAGWLFFLVLHLSQIQLFLAGNTLVVTDGQARPSFHDFWSMLLELVSFPSALIIGGVISFVVISKRPKILFPTDEDSRFLLLVAAGFLFIPIAYFVFAWVGLPKLTLRRYYYPTCLSGVLFSCYFLRVLMVDLRSRSSAIRLTVNVGIACMVISLLVYGTSKYWRIFESEPTILSFREDLVKDLFFENNGEIREVVTPNLHVYFAFFYHYPELRTHFYLLRATSKEAEGWKGFHREIQSMAPDRMLEFKKITFAYYAKSLNNFPDFDPVSWAKSNGFSYIHEDLEPLHGIYHLNRAK
jgi:hypothetical protein